MATTKQTIKLLVDKKQKRILFAEAEKDFIDFLFSLFSLPVGSVVRLLTKKDMVGCLGDLYESIENLSETYMQQNQIKESILKPKAAACPVDLPLLLPNEEEAVSQKNTTRKYYRCQNMHSITDTPGTKCASSNGYGGYCNNPMNIEIPFVASAKTNVAPASDNGGYVKGLITYMVMDNLVVKPMSTISSITLLNKLSVLDIGSLEEKVVDVGMEEGLELLKASLQSKTVLTDVFLPKVDCDFY